MVRQHNPAGETTDISASVTVITDGLGAATVGPITREFDDVRVVSVEDALRAPLPAHAIVASSSSDQVADFLMRLAQSADERCVQYVLPDGSGGRDDIPSRALDLFDVISIEPRDSSVILNLRRAREQSGTASAWAQRLTGLDARSTSSSPGVGETVHSSDGGVLSSQHPAAQSTTSLPADTTHDAQSLDSPRVAERPRLMARLRSRLARRSVRLVAGAILVALMGLNGLFAFHSFAGMMVTTLIAISFVACIAGLLVVRQRLDVVARRTQKVVAMTEQLGRRSKSLESQVRALKSATGVATANVGSSTAAVNELLQRLNRAASENASRAG